MTDNDGAECWCDPVTITVAPRESDGALLARLGADAMKWAEAFTDTEQRLERYADEAMLVAWFANAIEAGRSAGIADATAAGIVRVDTGDEALVERLARRAFESWYQGEFGESPAAHVSTGYGFERDTRAFLAALREAAQ